jgi:hypothetical protein
MLKPLQRWSPDQLVKIDSTKNWRTFADIMFGTEDADPGYMLLARAKMPHDQKLRYVLAWCAFYNPGLAAKACDYKGADFYAYLNKVYPTAKRASERRHFRGAAGLKALAQWQDLYPKPEKMVEACFADSYMGVRKNMQHMAQMGDYFYWKLADIQDTVFGMPVDFTGCEQYMPKVPKQGAEIIDEMESYGLDFDLEDVMETITHHVSKMKHPFAPHRPLALQEAETVCCVFKQHVVGDYKFGFRSAKAATRLQGMLSETKTAKVLLDGLYAGGIWTPDKLKAVQEFL